jgi:hypothetical protein
VLGGTVSAGAYTAGAIDFLIEALDCFETAKAQGRAPRHDVVLKLIAGTSGGGVNAAIAARALAYKFPHISRGTPVQEESTGNPFYDTWIPWIPVPPGIILTLTSLRGIPYRLNFDKELGESYVDDGAATLVGFAPGKPFSRQLAEVPPIRRLRRQSTIEPQDELVRTRL